MFNFFKKKKNDSNIYSPCKGVLKPVEEVKDEVFSSKAMGEGFAVKPKDGAIFSPVNGEIMSVFPTKHALGIKTIDGTEVLVHVGLDTVELEGKPFTMLVEEGAMVNQNTQLLEVDLEMIAQAGKGDDIIVVFPGAKNVPKLDVVGEVSAGVTIGSIK